MFEAIKDFFKAEKEEEAEKDARERTTEDRIKENNDNIEQENVRAVRSSIPEEGRE